MPFGSVQLFISQNDSHSFPPLCGGGLRWGTDTLLHVIAAGVQSETELAKPRELGFDGAAGPGGQELASRSCCLPVCGIRAAAGLSRALESQR